MKFTLSFIFLMFSCSSPKLVIKSNPDNATVSYFNHSAQNFETIGQTPLILDPKSGKIPASELSKMSVLKVEKEGYISENILIPGDQLAATEILLRLRASHEWLNKDRGSVSKVADDIARKLQMINRQTSSKNYREALTAIDELLVKYPKTPVFYDMKGSLHLLTNDRELARQSFQQSLELKPDNMQTRKILEGLK